MNTNSYPPLDTCICKWPDGSLREVVVLTRQDDTAYVIWNERHAPIDGQGCVVGLDDTVPLTWLFSNR